MMTSRIREPIRVPKRSGLLAWLAAMLLVLAMGAACPGQVLISEFMASNDDTLLDGDGNSSDWIELCNTGATNVDLTGWYLSDDAADPAAWAFPATNLAAGEYLVVFASGQETAGYVDSLGYLHTTFKLSADGESVVLTRPDGVTVEHSITNYPGQDEDVSYGIPSDSSYITLVAADEDAKAWVPTSDAASTNWHFSGFDDTGWLSGNQGVGYETGSGYDAAIGLDVESMQYQNGSVYVRIPFEVSDAASIAALSLRTKYDDGFAAFLNGVQIAGANAPSPLGWNSLATGSHEADLNNYVDFDVSAWAGALQDGTNLLAIQGLNVPLSSSDMLFIGELNASVAGSMQTNTLNYLPVPTPGSVNASGFLGYVADTTFRVDRGFFTNAFDVEIGCGTEGAAIYYTTDGTEPAAGNGTLYSGPIAITNTTVLRAAAFVSGWQPSDVDTQTYIFLDDIIAQGTGVAGLDPYFPPGAVNGQDFDYGMDTNITQSGTYASQMEGALLAIPSLSLVTDPGNLFDAGTGIYVNARQEGEAWEREMSLELIHPDGTDGFQINGGMRIRGESSTSPNNPKHSFRFLFKSEYGASRLNHPLFGGEGDETFRRMDLRTGQNFSWANQSPQYATWLYDIFTRDTHRDMEQPYTRGEYYHLYINGMYWGLYQTEERCDSRYAESYWGYDNDDFDAVKADGDTGDMYAVDGTRDAYEDLWAGLTAGVGGNAAYYALQGMNSDGTENSSYTNLLDVDNVIDYMLLIYFTGNRDSPIGPPNSGTMPRNVNSVYNRADPDGFKWVAHDNEHSLEIQEGVNYNRFTQTLASSFDGIDRMMPWWMHLKLMENDEYALRFADHVHAHFFNDGALTATETAARMAARKDEIHAAVVAESARWGDSAGPLRTRDDDWLGAVDWLLDTYMTQRTGIVLGQIESQGWYPAVAAPEFNQYGGGISRGFSLSVSGSGAIYYTTDGSDPRAIGGGVAGTAYSGSLTLNESTHVKARVLSGGIWSALTEAVFVVNEASPLRVTEIMYHPAAGSGTNHAASDYEFIELLNTGTQAVGLAGTEFTEGILFDFTEDDESTLDPGEYAVLVSDLDAFKERYTNWASIHIAGEFHGRFFRAQAALDNGGEQVTLADGLGNPILDFEYDDWYEITDGGGFSLTLIDATAGTNTWSEKSSWRPSATTNGTPGAGPVDFPHPGDLVINEVLSHQDQDDPGDWIELHNTSTNTLNINGWVLSDDDDDLMKVTLSGLSTIAPGGYLVLTEAAHFGTNALGTNGFALSELGDEIYLSSTENGELTGYRLEEDFDGIDRDVTFGRYMTGDGDADFPAQSAVTMGASNAYPRVGPIVITEINYHPAASNGYEFIELYNTASTNVALYDSAIPTNVWRLDGAVEYSFPTGTVMAPGAYLIITETNAAAFEAFYTVPGGTTVLGPYDGSLNNDGESVQLERPGDPEELTGEIPEILVERVVYDDEAPWPTEADGGGYSLRRLDMAAYANDSLQWGRSSVSATPGEGDTALISTYSEMTVAGTFNSWNAAAANMTLVDNYTWEWEATFSATSGVLFKFAADGSWDANWGDDDPASTRLPLSGTGDWFGLDIAVGETLDGIYVFTFNDQTLAYSLEEVADNPDVDGDGMDDDWELIHFGGTNAVRGGAGEDWDEDGSSNWTEFHARTIPTNPASVFELISTDLSSDAVVTWSSETGVSYTLWTCSDLLDGSFTEEASSIPATEPLNSHTTSIVSGEAIYIRLTVDMD